MEQPKPMDAFTHVKKITDQIRFCMMTTETPEGNLISRPMTTIETDAEGQFWFFAADDAEQTFNFDVNENVNLAYAAPDSSKYLSISGSASINKDREKIDALWGPMVAAWFPQGKGDPRICLIRVTPHIVEYWEGPSSKVVRLFEIAKALLTKTTPRDGTDHARVTR